MWDGIGGDDAGISLWLVSRREDGRGLSWGVELYMYREDDGAWRATAKGEIDLEDDQGHEHCVLNEQWPAANAVDAARAVRELADQVTTYPIDDLLTMNWQPEIVDTDAAQTGVPPGVTITATLRIERRDSDPDRWPDADD